MPGLDGRSVRPIARGESRDRNVLDLSLDGQPQRPERGAQAVGQHIPPAEIPVGELALQEFDERADGDSAAEDDRRAARGRLVPSRRRIRQREGNGRVCGKVESLVPERRRVGRLWGRAPQRKIRDDPYDDGDAAPAGGTGQQWDGRPGHRGMTRIPCPGTNAVPSRRPTETHTTATTRETVPQWRIDTQLRSSATESATTVRIVAGRRKQGV